MMSGRKHHGDEHEHDGEEIKLLRRILAVLESSEKILKRIEATTHKPVPLKVPVHPVVRVS